MIYGYFKPKIGEWLNKRIFDFTKVACFQQVFIRVQIQILNSLLLLFLIANKAKQSIKGVKDFERTSRGKSNRKNEGTRVWAAARFGPGNYFLSNRSLDSSR